MTVRDRNLYVADNCKCVNKKEWAYIRMIKSESRYRIWEQSCIGFIGVAKQRVLRLTSHAPPLVTRMQMMSVRSASNEPVTIDLHFVVERSILIGCCGTAAASAPPAAAVQPPPT